MGGIYLSDVLLDVFKHQRVLLLTDLKLIFLGTSASVPTIHRGLSSVAVLRDGELFLFDAGEGVQRSFPKAKIGFNRKMSIFISHLHGDHCVGLLGLLQTMSMVQRDKPLTVYGPRGLIGFIRNNIRSLKFGLTFPLEVKIVREGLVVETRDYFIKACIGQHRMKNFVYSLEEKDRPGVFNPKAAKNLKVPEGILWSKLQKGESVEINGKIINPNLVLGPSRKGRKIVISGDTRPTPTIKRFISGADLAVLESTYFDDHQEKAKENLHMTAREAAQMASEADVNQLALTHFSSRYDDIAPLLSQAQDIHPNLIVAEDFLVLNIQYPDEKV
jgi:ribonuclease Z|tara:strand:- start:1194 stop:2183 length:990 start_codon:yes stop_codon:yes gene_type:complete